MKLISFTRRGRAGFGAVVDGGIVDLTGRLRPDVDGLKEALKAGLLPQAAAFLREHGPDLTPADVTLLPVIPDPDKILCVGLNYETHRAETNRPEAKFPTIFTRYADSQVAHRQPILKPRVSDQLDYEAELALVIGLGGRHISEDAALSHVAGYACYNDGTVRDFQRHTHQFVPGKTFPGTGAFGPHLVTPDELGDLASLRIVGRLNGEVMQDARLSDLIFPVARLISYCSSFTPLSPGDVILTGTPGGVGDRRKPPLYMKDGDVFEVEITGVGRLVNRIEDEA